MQNFWWGYKHIEGSLHVKRFFGMKDISEALASDFIAKAAGPFTAIDREDAMNKLRDKI